MHVCLFDIMGSKQSTSNQVSSVSHTWNKSLTSLYEACRDGNEEQVRKFLPHYSQLDLNRQEYPNKGNTCLHIAAANGHADIVKLLLKAGCYRSKRLNFSNQTAYDLACLNGDSIRSLFLRPNETDSSSSRFYENNVSKCFDIVQVEMNARQDSQINDKDETRPTIQTFQTEEEKQHQIEYSACSKAMCQSSFGRFCVNRVHSDEPLDNKTILKRLHYLLDQITDNQSDDYLKINDLIKKFENHTDSIEHLLHLYTLETKFYRILKQDCLPLALPLFMHLSQLKHRFFRGRVYRGVCMSSEQFLIYQMSMEIPGTLLQTNTFSSTSINRHIAEQFAYLQTKHEDEFYVLFIFDFLEVCDQAINLSRISTDIPSISEYENEEEVLILPWTLFEVTRIHQRTNDTDLCTIYLTNKIIRKKHLLSTFKWTLVDLKHQLTRDKRIKFECAFQKYKQSK